MTITFSDHFSFHYNAKCNCSYWEYPFSAVGKYLQKRSCICEIRIAQPRWFCQGSCSSLNIIWFKRFGKVDLGYINCRTNFGQHWDRFGIMLCCNENSFDSCYARFDERGTQKTDRCLRCRIGAHPWFIRYARCYCQSRGNGKSQSQRCYCRLICES